MICCPSGAITNFQLFLLESALARLTGTAEATTRPRQNNLFPAMQFISVPNAPFPCMARVVMESSSGRSAAW